jgi:prohibitin 1
MKKSGLLFLCCLLAGLFSGGCTQINPGERGVVTHFGKLDSELMGEGMHWYLPFGTSVYTMSIKTVLTTIDTAAASKDMQEVKSSVALNWHLTPDQLTSVFKTVGDESQIETVILHPAANEAFKEATAHLTAEEVLSKRDQLVAEVQQVLLERLKNYGITVDTVSLVNLTFSDDYNKAIEAKQVMEQQAEQAKYSVEKAQNETKAQALMVQSTTKIMIMKQAVEKWDGHFPKVMGSGSLPLLDFKQLEGN